MQATFSNNNEIRLKVHFFLKRCFPYLEVKNKTLQLTLESTRLTTMQISFNKYTLGLHNPGFCICGFNQLQIKNTIFNIQLGLQGCGRPTLCIVLCYFIWSTLSTCGLRLKFWESQKLYTDFQRKGGAGAGRGVSAPSCCSRANCTL